MTCYPLPHVQKATFYAGSFYMHVNDGKRKQATLATATLYFHSGFEALLGMHLRTFTGLEFTLHCVKIIDQVRFSRKFGFCKGNICHAQY